MYLIAWFYEVKTKKRVPKLIVTYILSHDKKIKTIPYLGNVLLLGAEMNATTLALAYS